MAFHKVDPGQVFAATFIFAVVMAFAVSAQAQQNGKSAANSSAVQLERHITASPAYAEILLRKTDLSAELESLLSDYTEDHPKVGQMRFSLAALNREIERLAKVKAAESGKLTLALGKLIVRKVELETDLWLLLKSYKDEHPEVKRAKRKVEIYEAAIKEILG
jgi:uncharacterized protein involved in exopolysaccharide biosynthesis